MLSPALEEQHAGGADERPTVGSLFAGIGGIDLGLERVGFRTAWFCERDKFCQQVLAKHWPSVPCYDDVQDLGEDTPRVDVLAGGFPCQPISNAGKRLAQADERWLWPEVARLIRILRPRALLLENVAALLGRGFDDVISDLATRGYDAEWDCIPAAAVGAPHRRDRVFVVAYPNDEGPPRHRQPPPDHQCGAQEGHVAASSASQAHGGEQRNPTKWATEPKVGRMDNGIPRRVDRLRSLGNAVVPQVAEVVGRRLMEVVRDARA